MGLKNILQGKSVTLPKMIKYKHGKRKLCLTAKVTWQPRSMSRREKCDWQQRNSISARAAMNKLLEKKCLSLSSFSQKYLYKMQQTPSVSCQSHLVPNQNHYIFTIFLCLLPSSFIVLTEHYCWGDRSVHSPAWQVCGPEFDFQSQTTATTTKYYYYQFIKAITKHFQALRDSIILLALSL